VVALLLGAAYANDQYETTASAIDTGYGVGEACESDKDCERNTHCNYEGVCESDTTACYDDDECRGTDVCDMENYICIPSTPTPTEAPKPGCCHGDLTSYKANDKCVGLEDQMSCERKSCNWLITEDPEDCVVTTTTTTPRTTEIGCCAGTTAMNTAMCNEKIGQEQCERSGKCEFRVLEEDCSWPTTTETPWLGAKAQGNAMAQKRGGKSNNRRQESMLFGGDSAVAQTMSTQVSLSTVLLIVAAAFAVYQLYRWYANSNSKKTQTVSARPNYQSV